MRTSVAHGGGSTERLHFLLLQHTQELALQGRRHIADLIEEHRPATGQLKQPHLVVTSIGERTAPVTEELAFEECLGDRRTIHGEKGAGGSRTLRVQRSSQKLLPRPAFSNQQDWRIAERCSIDELHHGAHRARLGEDPGQNFFCDKHDGI